MLNGLLDEEADDLVGAESYERAAGHKAYRKCCRGQSDVEPVPPVNRKLHNKLLGKLAMLGAFALTKHERLVAAELRAVAPH